LSFVPAILSLAAVDPPALKFQLTGGA